MKSILSSLCLVLVGVATAVIVNSVWPPHVKYIYDDEARLVGYCQGEYLIREEEDEFPQGCYFIEPITWNK